MFNDSRPAAPGALDPSLSDNDLVQLARSDEAKVRAGAAAHPNTPLTMILKLAVDEAASVRAGVARNPRRDIPEEIFRELANDSVPDSVIARVMRGKHKDAIGPAKARLAKSGGRGGLLGALRM